jgi:hypothetical protein
MDTEAITKKLIKRVTNLELENEYLKKKLQHILAIKEAKLAKIKKSLIHGHILPPDENEDCIDEDRLKTNMPILVKFGESYLMLNGMLQEKYDFECILLNTDEVKKIRGEKGIMRNYIMHKIFLEVPLRVREIKADQLNEICDEKIYGDVFENIILCTDDIINGNTFAWAIKNLVCFDPLGQENKLKCSLKMKIAN